MGYDDLLEWGSSQGIVIKESELLNLDEVKSKIKQIIDRAKNRARTESQRSGLDTTLRKWVDERTSESSIFFDDYRSVINKNIERETEELRRKIEMIKIKDLKEPKIPEKLPETQKARIREEIKKQVETQLKKSIKITTTTKRIRETFRNLEESKIEVSPEIKRDLEFKRQQLLGESRTLTLDLRQQIPRATSLQELEQIQQKININKEVILNQEKGDQILSGLNQRIQFKKEQLQSQ